MSALTDINAGVVNKDATYNAAWAAVLNDTDPDVVLARQRLSIHQLRLIVRDIVEATYVHSIPAEIDTALSKLILMARTSGGTTGRDEKLCAALDDAEAALLRLRKVAWPLPPPPTQGGPE